MWTLAKWRYDGIIDNLKSRLELVEQVDRDGRAAGRLGNPVISPGKAELERQDATEIKSDPAWLPVFQQMSRVQQSNFLDRNNGSAVSIDGILESAQALDSNDLLLNMSVLEKKSMLFFAVDLSAKEVDQLNIKDAIVVTGKIDRRGDMLFSRGAYVRRKI
jgi:hypothetical protein